MPAADCPRTQSMPSSWLRPEFPTQSTASCCSPNRVNRITSPGQGPVPAKFTRPAVLSHVRCLLLRDGRGIDWFNAPVFGGAGFDRGLGVARGGDEVHRAGD